MIDDDENNDGIMMKTDTCIGSAPNPPKEQEMCQMCDISSAHPPSVDQF